MKPNSFAVKYKVTILPPVIPTIESEITMTQEKVADVMFEHL